LRKTGGAKRSGGKADHDSTHRSRLIVASTSNELAFRERDIGFEPTTFSLGRSAAAVGVGSTGLQLSERIRNRSERDSHSAPPEAPFSKDFVSGLCLEKGAEARGSAGRLLTVKEVAERLRVSTATVYGLCADGRLPHARILNVIRVAPADLVSFIASCRVAGTG
jgi:excisionase family DNA binding protein